MTTTHRHEGPGQGVVPAAPRSGEHHPAPSYPPSDEVKLRKQRIDAAQSKLYAKLDAGYKRPLLDAEFDRLMDKAYDAYNRAVDEINRDYPEHPPLTHW